MVTFAKTWQSTVVSSVGVPIKQELAKVLKTKA